MPQSRTAPVAARPSVEVLEPRTTPSVAVRFDYTYDTSGFFADPARRAALQRAADAIGSQLQDDLAAITPSGGDTWQASFFNPATHSTVVVDNPTIHENEIVVYVAAAPIGALELGLATTGGFTASGDRAWLDTVRARGQTGALTAPQTDYATWGGMVTFDSKTNWHFGSDNPAPNEYDFESVALHELMHVFGFGLGEPAFTRNVSNGQFIGPHVVAANGGKSVAVVGDDGVPDHWAPGTKSAGEGSPMQPALAAGEKRHLTPIDFAALQDIGWQFTKTPAAPPAAGAVAAVPPTPVLPVGQFAVGTAAQVVTYGSTGGVVSTAQPVPQAPAGATRVATADVNGDGVPDEIAGTGPGVPNQVTITDGATGKVLASFSPFERSFTGGVEVAAGDVTGDGFADVVVTPDQGGGPVVAVYDGASLALGRSFQLDRFLGVNDPNFRGGARAAVGDVNGDGFADIAVAAGAGGGPRVAVFDGRTVGTGGKPRRLVADFFAFEPGLRNGVNVAVADLDGDGKAEVICGAGPGGAPRVTVFGGRDLLDGRQTIVADFFAGAADQRGGVRVAAADVDADGWPDVITGSGSDGEVAVYASKELLAGSASPWMTVTMPDAAQDGVFVG